MRKRNVLHERRRRKCREKIFVGERRSFATPVERRTEKRCHLAPRKSIAKLGDTNPVDDVARRDETVDERAVDQIRDVLLRRRECGLVVLRGDLPKLSFDDERPEFFVRQVKDAIVAGENASTI